MRVLVLAVGRMKKGAEAELADRYLKRAVQAGRAIGIRSIEIVEIRESRAADADRRKLEEAIAIANVIPDGALVVLLDERGEGFSSAAFADQLGRWRDGGQAVTAFVIGGADGLSETLRDKARITLNFGQATWPHQLVRIMLLEQLYRAITIMSGHPYHRD
ncbi:23S rRNA (pseudouridine(1915)-N(3))-methyltransferase RlmH [Pseudorhodoplanes sp.]|uniref:23S rRNA (pseudouridine(1915)-N(3))-methyltransferase RlmH n=1 Tax=Pseudorhodoplanes sp. TaxID=1934341 RepID=UPI002B7AC045|nr:23S rRNA (pseudouridine(1915)-N(3))-methyltransferase RlmH [Pseudorhodoplanes sp.]HWV52864.1 23S rRNA (pseudouridine(1915)-N(3))-methyltransferase RlmH [Pseudorhodoplanes sp.]